MKWNWKFFFLFPAFISLSFAQVGLRTAPSIMIEKGFPKGTNIISDNQGFVYLEMTENVLVQKRDDTRARFDGEILPPTIIGPEETFYERKPRGRTRSIVAFEIASDTLESLQFIDYFKQIPQRSRARMAANLENPADLEQRTRLIIPLFENYNQPALWEYLGVDESESRYYKEQWERIGGVLESTPEEDIDLFTANIAGTGVYVLFDEDPDPSEEDIFIPYEEIQLAPEAPYQSVSPRSPSSPEIDSGEFMIDPTDPNQTYYPNGEVNIPTYEIENETSGNTNPLIIEPTPNFNIPPQINPLQAGTYNPNAVNTTFGIPNGPVAFSPPSSFTPPPLNVDPLLLENDLILETPEAPETLDPQAPINEEKLPTAPSLNLQKQKVEQLIQDRLLQDAGLPAPSLLEDPVSTPTQTPAKTPLLIPKEEDTKAAAPNSVQEALKAQAFSEETLQDDPEFYESAPKPLPKTGNKMLVGGMASTLILLCFGYYWFYIRNKTPKQLSIKLKK